MPAACSSDVVNLIASETGLRVERIGLSQRLCRDLGIDGDDAVALFDRVDVTFGTDLTRLHAEWGDHFAPEGFPIRSGLMVLAAAIVSGVAAASLGLGAGGAVAIMVALLLLAVWARGRWGSPDTLIPITVGDVVAAVESGRWTGRR